MLETSGYNHFSQFVSDVNMRMIIPVTTPTHTITDLPDVRYRRSGRARYQRITVGHDRTITVTVPRGRSQEEAERFVRSKVDWIKKQLKKIGQYNAKPQEKPDLTIDLDKAQDELFERLRHFSKKYDLPFRRAAFRCQKTRWGSCSSRNNISLNINIAFLPVHLQDYILLHELCHIRHKNHGKRFWAQLDKYVGGSAKLLQKEMREYRVYCGYFGRLP
jgi:hypothetical protein